MGVIGGGCRELRDRRKTDERSRDIATTPIFPSKSAETVPSSPSYPPVRSSFPSIPSIRCILVVNGRIPTARALHITRRVTNRPRATNRIV